MKLLFRLTGTICLVSIIWFVYEAIGCFVSASTAINNCFRDQYINLGMMSLFCGIIFGGLGIIFWMRSFLEDK